MLHDPAFHLDILKRKVKDMGDCEEVFCKSTKESVNGDIFQTVLVRDGGLNNEGDGTPPVKNVCEFLQRQVELCGNEYIMFHPKRKKRMSKVISPSMTTTLFERCCKEVKNKVIGTFDSCVVCNEIGDGSREPFMEFVRYLVTRQRRC